jgi:hypothetical protein
MLMLFYCDTGSVTPLPHTGGRQRKLQDQEVLYIEQLKREKPSIYLSEIKDKLDRFSNVSVSLTTIGTTVRERLQDGNWSRKIMVTPAAEKFTPNNINYTQGFLDYMSRQNPYKLKYFDESGFNMPDSVRRKYGHSPVGQPAVEIDKHTRTPHLTLNLMVGLNGIAYANVVEGATDTDRYLNFFHEAAHSVDDAGNPALTAGDIVIVDNCATHRNRGGAVLSQYLHMQGIEYVFTPSYSPDMNPAEMCFRHIKTVLKNDHYRRIAQEISLEYAVLSVVNTITAGNARSYFRDLEYINV